MENTTVDKKQVDLTLFGAGEDWKSEDWTSSDDSVRGGKSRSYLECLQSGKLGRFYGTLDIKTLGGAGFASQRTTGEDRKWDLSEYAGVELAIAKGDKKRYIFIVKDQLPKSSTTGRDEATISWEVDFELPPQAQPGETEDRFVFLPWKSFTPTYRGRPVKPDADPIDLKSIRRMSIMMRSFFGTQEGDFSLSMKSIKALRKTPEKGNHSACVVDSRALEEGTGKQQQCDPEHFVVPLNFGAFKTELKLHKRTTMYLMAALATLAGAYRLILALSWS